MNMQREFKVGDIVRDGTFISSIKKIEDGKATLTKNYEVALERLSQVEINGNFDHNIILDCKNSVRASIVAPGRPLPIRKSILYLDDGIGEKSIMSIVEDNGFTVVSELQDWISQNEPNFFLRTKIGI
jgi:hypothetical protein